MAIPEHQEQLEAMPFTPLAWHIYEWETGMHVETIEEMLARGFTPWAIAYVVKNKGFLPGLTDFNFVNLMQDNGAPLPQIAEALHSVYEMDHGQIAALFYERQVSAHDLVPILLTLVGGLENIDLVLSVLNNMDYSRYGKYSVHDVAQALLAVHGHYAVSTTRMAGMLFKDGYTAEETAAFLATRDFDDLEIAGILLEDIGYGLHDVAGLLGSSWGRPL